MSVKRVVPGARLAQNILDERGRVLLAAGVELTSSLARRLSVIGIRAVFIEDAQTADLDVREFVPQELRRLLLRETYTALKTLPEMLASRGLRQMWSRRVQAIMPDVVDHVKAASDTRNQLGTVYLSDGELYHHSVNVSLFAIAIGLAAGYARSAAIELGVGALLHDVGKVQIPPSVLHQPRTLTAAELAVVRLHPRLGADLLRQVEDLSPVAALVALQHHERVDGGGYPSGLRQGDLHPFSRITAVADVYEALTANRRYRQGYLPHVALEYLLGAGGTVFDADVVRAFVDAIAVYPVGMTLLLSNGDWGVVVRANRRQTQRPVVRLLTTDGTSALQSDVEVNLAEQLTLQIVSCEG